LYEKTHSFSEDKSKEGLLQMKKYTASKLGLIGLVAVSLALPACQTFDGMGTKQTVGAGTGAVLGGLLGSRVGKGSGQLWGTGAGVLLGALIGSEIGQSLDRADQAYMGQAVTRAQSAPIGETISWRNPESGNSCTIKPTRDGYSSAGRYCREYQQTIIVGGKSQSAYGQACQQPDGSWQIVS
jgi:surface antigen